jgi:VWFA-related protein
LCIAVAAHASGKVGSASPGIQSPEASTLPAGTTSTPTGGAERGTAFGGNSAPFEESIEVTVVSLEVVVRDSAGKLVPGLTRDDFKLFVDRQPVPITNFYASDGTPSPPPAATSGTAGLAASKADTGIPDQPKRENLALVVYIDNANLRPFDRNRLLKQLRIFLRSTLQPGDRVLVVTTDPGLHLRHSFRESLDSLWVEMDKIEKETAYGLSQSLARRQAIDQIQDLIQHGGGCGKMFGAAKGFARAQAESTLNEVRTTYANLHHMLRSLGSVEGRKALLYVGDGVPTQVGLDVFGVLEDLCPSQSLHLVQEPINATGPLQQVIADANANLVTLYTLEAAGLSSYASAEQRGPSAISFDLSRRLDLDRQNSLFSLARETGGRAALNGNDFSHDLEAISAELDASYSLGFTPARAGEGKTHQIRIEVNRPGLHASYRSSYRDRTPKERLDGQVEAALIHGETDNPLAASLKVGAAVPSDHGHILVPIQVRVPFAKLAFLPGEDAQHGQVDIVVGNMDAHGGMAPLQRMQLPLRIPAADAKKILASHLGYDVKLLLDPGRQRLAFVVRDDLARISSCVVQELEVDKKGTVNLALVHCTVSQLSNVGRQFERARQRSGSTPLTSSR